MISQIERIKWMMLISRMARISLISQMAWITQIERIKRMLVISQIERIALISRIALITQMQQIERIKRIILIYLDFTNGKDYANYTN
jgi:hypothetical protein